MNRMLIMVCASMVAMFAAGWGVQHFLKQERPDNTAISQKSVQYKASELSASQQTAIQRDASGQFHITGQVNGEDTLFLVDTGADVVALTPDEAGRLGIDADPAMFEPIMQTASGTGNGIRITLDRLEVAGEELQNVDAVVVEGLPVNLLGQSALRQLGKVELRGDRLVIDRQS
jgi:aspartyl protease family protein